MRFVPTPAGVSSVRDDGPSVHIQEDSIFRCERRKKSPWGYLLEKTRLQKRLYRGDEGYVTSLLGRWALYTMEGEE